MSEKLTRFQADILANGTVTMSSYWSNVVISESGDTVQGPFILGFERYYQSLPDADNAALRFPEFADLADQFKETPFTAFCALLEAIRKYQVVIPEETP